MPVIESPIDRRDDEELKGIIRSIHQRFLPRTVLAFHPDSEEAKQVTELIPFLAEQRPVDGKATAYVCEGYACKAPVTTVRALLELLR